MTVALADLDRLDLADPVVHAENDLHPVWARLRATEPVRWHPATAGRPGFWVVTRYADAVEVFRDTGTYSSARGNVLASLLAGGDTASGVMAAVSDGTRHRALRQVLMAAFAPRLLDAVRPQVTAHAEDLIEQAVALGDCDFAEEVAARLPMTVICELLAVPVPDRARLLTLTRVALSSDTAEQDPLDVWEARNEILAYFQDLADDRRDSPGDDAVSVLVDEQFGLTADEVVANCYSLILGGDETARLSMSGAVHALAGHPGQWRDLRDGTVGVDTAVDEVLRWTTPAQHFGRTATTGAEIAGTRIAAGDIVTVWTCSANRDEDHFDRPDRYDLGRTPNRHLAFGHGPHYCIGAYLGRMEIAAVLTALRDRVGGIEMTADPKPVYSTMLSGYRSVPVKLTPPTS